jgi:hypothetical protein
MASQTIRSSSRSAVLAVLAGLLLHCAPPAASAPVPPKKAAMSKYDDAVRLLASPKTWCAGAKELVTLKDARALVPLVAAYDRPVEAEKLCLADAMEALGAETAARTLVASKNADERRTALRLMAMFASDEQLPFLRDAALNDLDASLRNAALDAMAQQHQNTRWETTVAGFLARPEEPLRAWALDRLIAHGGDSSWAYVSAHAAHEQSPALRAKIDAAQKTRPKH